MKKYIDAELQIVRMNNNDIVTNSANISINGNISNGTANAPARRSIWD